MQATESQATESPVDVPPPQAATKIMAGIAEWQNGRNGGTAERMAEWQKLDTKTYIHTNGGNGGNGGRNGRMVGMVEW